MPLTGPVIPKAFRADDNIPDFAPTPDALSVIGDSGDFGEIITCLRTGRMWVLGKLPSGGPAYRPISGSDVRAFVHNNSGATIPKGSVVYVTGSNGVDKITIALADANVESMSAKTIGVVWENISNGADGFIVTEGLLTGIATNTIGNAGDAIWLSATAGSFTTTRPTQPDHGVFIGWIVKSAGAGAGSIFVKVINYPELDELHDVLIPNPLDNEALIYDAASGLWKNEKVSYSSIQDVEASSLLGRSNASNGVAQEIKLSNQFVWGTAGGKPQLSIATTSDATKVDTSTTLTAGVGLTGGGDLTTSRSFAVDFATSGTVSTTKAVRADDARLSDARTPVAHAHLINDLTDFAVSAVADKNVLQYSSATGKWVNAPQTDLVDGGNF
jgi:hypothetical protein